MENEFEKPFAKIPETRPDLREFFEQNKGWSGFNTPYSDVLRPLFFDDNPKKDADLVLVDFGCGWGEHVTLAGLGFAEGDIPRVKKAIGLGVDAGEIETANVLKKLAEVRPSFFRNNIMTNADVGLGSGLGSPTVDNLRKTLKSPELAAELETILDSQNEHALTLFIKKHVTDKIIEHEKPELSTTEIEFSVENIYNPKLPDDFADRIICSSVSSYIEDPDNEKAMWQNILRILKSGGIANVISFEYERDGKLTSAPEQFMKNAKEKGIQVELIQKRDKSQVDAAKGLIRQSIFRITKDDKDIH